jgi:hypothetical protein
MLVLEMHREGDILSGNDERILVVPECPQCGACREWFLGAGIWAFPQKAMEARHIKKPLFVEKTFARISKYFRFGEASCNSCGHLIMNGEELYASLRQAVMSAIAMGNYYNSFEELYKDLDNTIEYGIIEDDDDDDDNDDDYDDWDDDDGWDND